MTPALCLHSSFFVVHASSITKHYEHGVLSVCTTIPSAGLGCEQQ